MNEESELTKEEIQKLTEEETGITKEEKAECDKCYYNLICPTGYFMCEASIDQILRKKGVNLKNCHHLNFFVEKIKKMN